MTIQTGLACKHQVKPFNINRPWKRLVGFGCSHGHLIDPLAEDAVIRFVRNYKPDTVIHLGDYLDTDAWRSHLNGDVATDPVQDIYAGYEFLQKAGVTHLCMGNHDERPYRYVSNKDERIRFAAEQAIKLAEHDIKKLGIKYLASWSNWKWFQFGDTKFLHGTIFNKRAAADMATMYEGNVVFAHTHVTMLDKSETIGNHTGICVGTLSQIENMEYPKSRRRTMAWSQGIVFGEYCDNETKLWLHENGRNSAREPWRLPV